jgi:hypothetical protein
MLGIQTRGKGPGPSIGEDFLDLAKNARPISNSPRFDPALQIFARRFFEMVMMPKRA